MKSSIFTYDFFVAALMLTAVIIVILNLNFNPSFYIQRNPMDTAISLDDKGIFWKDENEINNSINGDSVVINCYKYNNGWRLDYQKKIINGNPKFWYRLIRVHEGDFCTIDVGK